MFEVETKWLERHENIGPIHLTHLRRICNTAALKRRSSQRKKQVKS